MLAAAIIGSAVAASATAGKESRLAPAGKGIYAGVSDTGSKQDYFEFAERAGAHIPVLQAFEPWGRWPEEAKQRWKRTETRGMLSVSTAPCYECEEVISPGRSAAAAATATCFASTTSSPSGTVPPTSACSRR